MIILGIDPGTRYAGYAIIKREKQKTFLLEYGCLNVSKKKNLIEKIGTLYEYLCQKVTEFNITHLVIETPFLNKNPSTFLKLGYVRGILYLIAHQNNLNISEFSPSEVKQAITGYGKATKEQVANVVLKMLKIRKPQRDDTTDAIAIALCGLWRK